MADSLNDLNNMLPRLTLPKRPPQREEDCGTCYWSHPNMSGRDTDLECHGGPPTVHVLMVPVEGALALRGQAPMRPQPICVWPPVRSGIDFCAKWEAKQVVALAHKPPAAPFTPV